MLWSEWLYPPNIGDIKCIEAQTPDVTVLGGGALGRRLVLDEVMRIQLHEGVRALIRRGRDIRVSSPSYVRIQQEVDSLQTRRGLLPKPNHAGTPISDFPASRTMKINFCQDTQSMVSCYGSPN